MFPSLSFSPLLADFPSIQEIFFLEEQMGRGALGKNESLYWSFFYPAHWFYSANCTLPLPSCSYLWWRPKLLGTFATKHFWAWSTQASVKSIACEALDYFKKTCEEGPPRILLQIASVLGIHFKITRLLIILNHLIAYFLRSKQYSSCFLFTC